MQKKLSRLGRKTGLKDKELKKMCRFSLSGLLAVAVASLTGCLETNKNYQSEPSADQSQTPASSNTGVSTSESVSQSGQAQPADKDKSTSTPQTVPEPKESEQCGPYPGYPCGTKYHTVSINDFEVFL
jgi:hypothetical protein